MNLLKTAISPYLLQHSQNPVEWYPWCPEAFQKAREENKPVLLSIGYAACHWCHVMAHESFEDEETAALMNQHFVNIKVDREERPDIDNIYQSAHYILRKKGGGWPLTMFLTEDQIPFWGGTYFPKRRRLNFPDFKSVLNGIINAWQEKRIEILAQNEKIMEFFLTIDGQHPESIGEIEEFAITLLDQAEQELLSIFDKRRWGGLGNAPKFPHPVELDFCLRRSMLSKQKGLTENVIKSLKGMMVGGIHDHLAGGFCRYSTDERWEVPHFEKMLYDNALLLPLYIDAWLYTNDRSFKETAEMIAKWVDNTMQDKKNGHYFSSIDADTDGIEGKHYLWTENEIKNLIASKEEATLFFQNYRLAFNAEIAGGVLVQQSDVEESHESSESYGGMKGNTLKLMEIKEKLLNARNTRTFPQCDDKALSSWNSLMAKGMLRAGRILDNSTWIISALKNMDFLKEQMWKNGKLSSVYRDKRFIEHGHLDDYANFLGLAIEIAQYRCTEDSITFAREIADDMIENFEDKKLGGFYFTSCSHEKLIRRIKPIDDGPTPSGNGVVARCLQDLGRITGDSHYEEVARRVILYACARVSHHPSTSTSILQALSNALYTSFTVILSGENKECDRWWRSIVLEYTPNIQVIIIGENCGVLPPILENIKYNSGSGVTAYLCKGSECSLPVNSLATLKKEIRKSKEHLYDG